MWSCQYAETALQLIPASARATPMAAITPTASSDERIRSVNCGNRTQRDAVGRNRHAWHQGSSAGLHVVFDIYPGRKAARQIEWLRGGQRGGLDVTDNDLVLATIGSPVENTVWGDHHNREATPRGVHAVPYALRWRIATPRLGADVQTGAAAGLPPLARRAR
jgi:hypothetical protein